MSVDKIKSIIADSISVKQAILQDATMIARLEQAIEIITQTFERGNKVLFCGNGGSAADAQHLAAEFSGRFYLNRRALPAEALHCNTSYLTAVANDFSYDDIFARLLDGLGKDGDVIWGLSTSGNSTNVVKAFEVAHQKGITTLGFTGSKGGKMKELSDVLFNVPSDTTPRIQESHILLGHIICEFVESNIFKG